ncbi:peptidoglycan-associated lipoprotein Pal [Futiania mangrovi]|uniref:Peptidoglycan-associated protein n=1 Tax=Futiania mangrovi TaxID=2959716 RepID=A0A9J6PE48_9PROT|nr:peptidoglycan-associated lipoprotein Pal [Futiania mangrovii]MCP1334895.1 peptidoglycan-associated lipoprotein Pal [Futiania mangrovii]
MGLSAAPKLALLVSLMMGLAACSSTDSAAPVATGAGAGGTGVSTGRVQAGPAPGTVEEFQVEVGDRVFFGTDEYALSPDAQNTLRAQAAWLMQYPQAAIVIEGHADERGTREYNLALGDRRASSVRNYLVALGVPGDRIRTVSYGKERPVALCSNESCWSENRRAVTVVTGVPSA